MGSVESERLNFRERLVFSLAEMGWAKMSPTRLAEQFNLRAGVSAVSVHSARKWLMAGAIPTQERLAILAEWLQVQPEWLRFGASADAIGDLCTQREVLSLLRDLASLDRGNKKLVREMLTVLLVASRKQQANKKGD